jgi:(S)-ureidoglycine aminohydrolase
MITRLGQTRTVVTTRYALIAPDGHVASALPGWTRCRAIVQISASMGARFSQYQITLEPGGRGEGETNGDSWFFFVVSGAATVNGAALSQGGFAYVPPDERYVVSAASASDATLLVFRKFYEPLPGSGSGAGAGVSGAGVSGGSGDGGGLKAPRFFSAQEQAIPEAPFLGDPHARLKVLIPDTPAADMAINIFTYDPGATLPFVETHVMEHGMLFLAGGGIYRLDGDWHPVMAGDAIWIAPYCPQWFIAAGPEPARYIYYKDVNRLPA